MDSFLLLLNEINKIPSKVGVYLFLNKENKPLYIGKSTNLNKRVSSYFKKENLKNKLLVAGAFYIKYILVSTNDDALFLENSLIKKHKPKYNILLKDDKSFPWICIKNERFPRVFITRKKNNESDFYFGPYTSKKILNSLYDLITKMYPIRSCKYDLSEKNIVSKKYKVCLDYHIKKCLGPCEGFQDEKSYNTYINSIKNILNGRYFFVIKQLNKNLLKHSKNLEFEKSEKIKNQIKAIKNLTKKSVIVSSKKETIYSFYIISFNNYMYLNFIKIIEGSIVFLNNYRIKNNFNWKEEFVLESFIKNEFFNNSFISKNFISNIKIGGFLNLKTVVPKTGYKKNILNLAYTNLIGFINSNNNDINFKVLKNLKKDLFLKKIPIIIECFDISNLQGNNTIGSCVVFKNKNLSKKNYSYYKLNTVGINDYYSIEEVLKMRYLKTSYYPDLIIIDGGKGQLKSAKKSLNYLGLSNIDIISIAKKDEIIYLKNYKNIILNKNSKSLKLIQNLRNEAHNYCLKYHRFYRNKDFLKSDFNNINGIGKTTILKLFKKFKNIKNIKNSNKEDLIKLIGKKKADELFKYLNN